MLLCRCFSGFSAQRETQRVFERRSRAYFLPGTISVLLAAVSRGRDCGLLAPLVTSAVLRAERVHAPAKVRFLPRAIRFLSSFSFFSQIFICEGILTLSSPMSSSGLFLCVSPFCCTNYGSFRGQRESSSEEPEGASSSKIEINIQESA